MNKQKFASLVASSVENNAIFDLNHPSNRDDCFLPYFLIKELFKQHNIEINTLDAYDSASEPVLFEIHMDVRPGGKSVKQYLLMLETPQIHPSNGISSNWHRYRKVFTWNDALVDNSRFIKINFPNAIRIHPVDGYAQRDRFCCLIAANKSLTVSDERDLYVERIRTIRWFEQHAPADFDLYGIGWDIPAWGRGRLGKLSRRIFRAIAPVMRFRSFPSYRGQVKHKREILSRTRFSICYENVRDLPGYITEKIFDCFFAGCIPIYWGAGNITDHIPADCFIDRRRFGDEAALYAFLKSISEDEFQAYQQRIADFLGSEAAYPFSAQAFAETVVTTIVQDLDSQA